MTPEEKKAKRKKHNEDTIRFLMAEFSPVYEREYRFHPDRKWRFDYAWVEAKIAVEIHGGIYAALPSHTLTYQRERDMEKLNEAQAMGWKVFQFTYRMIEQDIDGALSVLRRALGVVQEGTAAPCA